MDCRGFWCDRYVRGTPPTRLMIYGIIVLLVIVATILFLVPSPIEDEPQPMPEPTGANILKTVPLVDGYNALPVELMVRLKGVVKDFPFNTDMSTDEKMSWCRTSIPELQKGLVGTQVFTVKPSCDSQFKDASSKTLQQVDALNRLLSTYPNEIKRITSADEISRTKDEGKLGVIIGLDGGHAIDNKLALLRTYHSLGIRYLTLNSECGTPWSSSYTAKNDNNTIVLTEFGKVIVKEMNRLGMIIDLGRSSTRTQLAVLQETEAPVIFTATAAYNITPTASNVEDEVLEELKKNQGLVMITFNARLLSRATNSSGSMTKYLISHLNYVRKVVGVDHVGLAAGFHKGNSVPLMSLNDSSKYPLLFDRLATPQQKNEPNWTADDLKKLAGLNFIRVWKNVEEVSQKKSEEELPIDSLINPEDIPKEERACYSDV